MTLRGSIPKTLTFAARRFLTRCNLMKTVLNLEPQATAKTPSCKEGVLGDSIASTVTQLPIMHRGVAY